METYQAPAPAGSKLLKVVGILMIIFSAITLVVGIVGLVGLGALLAVSNGTVRAWSCGRPCWPTSSPLPAR